jgi:ATP-dependent helicase/nuclease subunit B
MVGAGGFADIPALAVQDLAFWQLHGRAEGGSVKPVEGDAMELARKAREGLEQLIATFDRPETRYEARPNPEIAPTYSDYLHLARVKEWGAVLGEDPS